MAKPVDRSRRNMLLGGLTLGAIGSSLIFKPKDIGASHSAYFEYLSQAMDRESFSKPTLVIDKAKLTKNIAILKHNIGNSFDYRIVAKSLPSLPLLEAVMAGTGTNRLMLFHQPFINQVAEKLPDADVLLGKPMPVAAAANFYKFHKGEKFDPSQQLQWLMDSPQRVKQYQQLSAELGISMRLNIELDVGLHRGGVKTDQVLTEMLNIIEADPALTFSGFMGYEPHIVKVPGNPRSHRDKAMDIYRDRLRTAEIVTGRGLEGLTLNAAGSPSYRYYLDGGDYPLTELSAGSCLVKPTDFDIASLEGYEPASYIATPVIKGPQDTEIPGVPGLSTLMAMWNPNRAKTFYTYGGYWKAKPESPQGMSVNPVYGRSTNQEMHNGSASIDLAQDDWLFLRPTQSESVFLQFGDIAVYEDGEISEQWPILAQS